MLPRSDSGKKEYTGAFSIPEKRQNTVTIFRQDGEDAVVNEINQNKVHTTLE